jgi:hypothetical protein
MNEPKRKGRPRKAPESPQVVEGQALTVYEGKVIPQSREDRREAAREQRKRDQMRRKAERAAMAIWLLNQTAKQVVKGSDSEFGESNKTAKQAQAKIESAGLDILTELADKLKEDLW